MKSLRERIAVEQAYLDGEIIVYAGEGEKYREPEPVHEWVDMVFRWDLFDYKLKPKPMVRYIFFYDDGSEHVIKDKEIAVMPGRVMKFIEAVEQLDYCYNSDIVYSMKNDYIRFRLPKALKAEFKDKCWWQRESMADVLTAAIKLYLKKHGNKL